MDEDETSVPDCWNAETLDVTGCERCPALVDSRSRIVSGVGPTDADLLFVGEAPGAHEDEQGEPFVGRSGDVLDSGLRDAGLDRVDVRITNCVRCRPPDNRDPTRDERESCRGYLEREIAAVDPELVVTLGKVPSEHLLGRSVGVTSEAGEVNAVEIGVNTTACWCVCTRQQRCTTPASGRRSRGRSRRLPSTLVMAASRRSASSRRLTGENQRVLARQSLNESGSVRVLITGRVHLFRDSRTYGSLTTGLLSRSSRPPSHSLYSSGVYVFSSSA